MTAGENLTVQNQVGGNRRALVVAGIILAIIGSVISIYSIQHHRTLQAAGQTDAFCNINQTFNCDEVAKSQYSEIWGAPLGAYGLGYFLALIVLLGIAFKPKKGSEASLQFYALMVAIGVLVSVILGGISTIQLGTACITCIMIYIVTILQAVVLWIYRNEIASAWEFSGLANAAVTSLLVVGVIIIGYKNLLSPAPKAPIELAADGNNPLAYTNKTYQIPIAKNAYSGFGEDYRKGGDNASVVLVEFADFQCPSCARFATILSSLNQEFGDRILIVFKNFPLDKNCNPSMTNQLHENACVMALGARCAGQFGKFWDMHDQLYLNQKDANEAEVKKMLVASGIANSDVEACFSSPSKYEKIRNDVDLGQTLDVDGTPSLYINGRKYIGSKDYNDLKLEIERLLVQ